MMKCETCGVESYEPEAFAFDDLCAGCASDMISEFKELRDAVVKLDFRCGNYRRSIAPLIGAVKLLPDDWESNVHEPAVVFLVKTAQYLAKETLESDKECQTTAPKSP
jgi:hypothetical protein